MATANSARLDRKKLLADPVMVIVILLIMAFLILFILYPLWTVTMQSFSRSEADLMTGLKDVGAWMTDQAEAAGEPEGVFAQLGANAAAYSKEYNKTRKTSSEGVQAARAALDQSLADVKGDPAALDAFVRAVNGSSADHEPISAELVTARIAEIERCVSELGKFALSLDAYLSLFRSKTFMQIVRNTLVLGMISGLAATIIGFIFAYVDMYTKTRFGGMFKVISVLPIVSPPFVLSLSAIMLFGKRGLITKHLFGMLHANIQGLQGIVLVQTLTFFPVCYLMLKGLLANIDPSLEESARNMGASRWKVFTTVTLPLLLPGIGNAFLVTFIEAVADFTNPVMIGGDYTTLAQHIYAQYSTQSDARGPAAMAVVLLLISMILFILEKYWLERKSVATLSGKASRARMPIKDKSVTVPLVTFCLIVSVLVVGMYALIPLGGLFQQWGRKFNLVTEHFAEVFGRGIQPFSDSLKLSLIAAPITALISMIIAYLVVKKKFLGRGLMEFMTMFAMAVPGTVLGIALVRGYITGVGGTGVLTLVGTGAIIVIAFVVRSLPIGTRSGVAALNQIDKSIEESAYDLGAGSGKVFFSVTLPLIKDSFFSGLVTTFARSITATSAVIFLISARHQLITPQIMTVVDRGDYSVACAYATVMMLMVYGSIAIMNLLTSLFGTSRRQKRAQKKEAAV